VKALQSLLEEMALRYKCRLKKTLLRPAISEYSETADMGKYPAEACHNGIQQNSRHGKIPC